MTKSLEAGGSLREPRFVIGPANPRIFGLVIFLAAFLVTASYNVLVWDSQGPRGDTDAAEYDLIGRSVAAGDGFLGAKRPPLFPAFLAAVFSLFGPQYLIVRLLLSAMAAGTCCFIYGLGRAVADERTARWSAGLACIYPPLLVWAGRLYAEMQFTFLITGFAFFLSRSFTRGSRSIPQQRTEWSNLLAAGALLGLAALTRAAASFFFLLLPLWAWWSRRGEPFSRTILRLAAVIVPALVLIAPWTYRNYLVTGAFVPISTGGGTVLIGSNNPVTVSGSGNFPPGIARGPGTFVFPRDSGLLTPAEIESVKTIPEVDRDRFYRKRTLEYVRGHPFSMVRLTVFKMLRLFELIPPSGGWRKIAVLIPYYGVLALAVAGAWISRRRWREMLPLWLLTAATLGQVAITWGTRRFRHPMEPVLVILAGIAVANVVDRIHRRRRGLGGIEVESPEL